MRTPHIQSKRAKTLRHRKRGLPKTFRLYLHDRNLYLYIQIVRQALTEMVESGNVDGASLCEELKLFASLQSYVKL